MRIALLAAALAVPSAASAQGRLPKVCLVTFGSSATRAAQDQADVVAARYLPLATAMKLERRTDDISDIYSFGPMRYDGLGIDFSYVGDSTKTMCQELAEQADSDQWSD